MRKEKIIAIIVTIFNCLTNLLMLLPSFLFGMLISEGLDSEREFIPYVVVGIPAIIFSYIYSIYFIRSWFFKKYEQERTLLTWSLSIFHYAAFLAYMVWIFLTIDEVGLPLEVYLILTPILIPLILAFAGFSLNQSENFAEQKNWEDIDEPENETSEMPSPDTEEIALTKEDDESFFHRKHQFKIPCKPPIHNPAHSADSANGSKNPLLSSYWPSVFSSSFCSSRMP